MVYIDGVPISYYKALAREYNEKIDEAAKKNTFNENLLLSFDVEKEDNKFMGRTVYIGKDYKFHKDEFEFSDMKDVVVRFKDKDYYSFVGIAGSYHDKDAGVGVVFKNGLNTSIDVLDSVSRCAFDYDSDTRKKMNKEFFSCNKHCNFVQKRHMFQECREGIEYLSTKEEDTKKKFTDMYQPFVEFHYNERNWRSDFCVEIKDKLVYEINTDYEHRMDKRSYQVFQCLSENDKCLTSGYVDSLEGVVDLKGYIDKEHTGITYDGSTCNIFVAKDLNAMAAFLESKHDQDFLDEMSGELLDFCKAGMKSLEIGREKNDSTEMSVEVPDKTRNKEQDLSHNS